MNGPGGRGFTRKIMDPISVQLLGVVLRRRCIPLASSTSSLAAAQGTSSDARGRTRRPELCWLDAFRPSLIMPLSSPSFRSSSPPRIVSVSASSPPHTDANPSVPSYSHINPLYLLEELQGFCLYVSFNHVLVENM
ncbi:hypothetical protein BHM03_00043617 [Ensete ventricosum]|nr:hypothetical protein BHM03_00043617 [Ensete ventricosum]